MHFDDLTPYSYYLSGRTLDDVRNVGWLDQQHSFRSGDVSQSIISKLRDIALGSVSFCAHVNMLRGFHPCSLCHLQSVTLNHQGEPLYLGQSELWIPTDNVTKSFAAPSMLLHYVEVHRYVPPENFTDAVLNVDLTLRYNAQREYEIRLASTFTGTAVDSPY
jgi:hypothetical protein